MELREKELRFCCEGMDGCGKRSFFLGGKTRWNVCFVFLIFFRMFFLNKELGSGCFFVLSGLFFEIIVDCGLLFFRVVLDEWLFLVGLDVV